MTTKPGSTSKTPPADASGVLLASSFSPAPVANQASDYTLTITNKAGKAITITAIVIDVGQGKQIATYNLAGESSPPSASQDFVTARLEWTGSLAIANGASTKVTFPGGFTGTAGACSFPSITLTSTPKLTTSTFAGPKITVK